jgi:hypothetical protein
MNDYLAIQLHQSRLDDAARAAKLHRLVEDLKQPEASLQPEVTLLGEDCPPPQKPALRLLRLRPRTQSA